MRLTDEPAATIRAIIGDERADELGRVVFGLQREHHFSCEELEYLSGCFDYLAWLASEGEEDKALGDGVNGVNGVNPEKDEKPGGGGGAA